MGAFLSKRGSIISELFMLPTGTELVDIALYEDYLEISETLKREKNKEKVQLPYKDIVGISYERENGKLLLTIQYAVGTSVVKLVYIDTRHLKGRKLVKKLRGLTGIEEVTL